MSVKLNSYILFSDGQANDAINFYKSVFGGEAMVDTFGGFAERTPDSGMPVNDVDKDKVMHGYLKADNGLELMVSDMPSGMPGVQKGNQISLTLNGDDEETLKGYWAKLSEGGEVVEPLVMAPWGDLFGIVTDKYGISWMFDIGPIAK